MKRFMTLLIALLMCAGAIGCASTPGGNDNESKTAGDGKESDQSKTESGEDETEEETEGPVFAGMEEKNFGGKDFKFLYRTTEEYQFYTDAITGDAVNDAVRDRNLLVESTFGVKIVGIPVDGEWGKHDAYMSMMKKAILANDGAYDLIDGYAAVIGGAYADGLMLNLNEIGNLRLTSPWWSQFAVDELTVNGKLFSVPGDLSLNLWKNMQVMYFNKTVMKDHDVENPYTAVREGTWTYDKYLELNNGIANDENGNGEKDTEDRFGSVYYDDLTFDNFHYAFDISYTLKNDDGSVSLNLNTPLMVDVYEKINDLAYNNPDVYYIKGDRVSSTNMFTQNRALFFASVLEDAENMRDMDSDFGIIPYPKLDETQKYYKTTSRDGRSMFCIPIDAGDPDYSGLITEALCVASNRILKPVYYEKVLKGRVARDTESSEMLDIIREGLTFDFVAEHSVQTARAGFILRDCIYYERSYATYEKQNHKVFDKAFSKFVSYYMDK